MSLHDFRSLGNGIFLYTPVAQKGGKGRDQPTLIILCTWLGGATSKRIQKYTEGYHRAWPNSSILLVRTVATEYAFLSEKALIRKLRPAQCEIRRIIEGTQANDVHQAASPSAAGLPTGKDPSVLLHVFSNGGANMAIQLVTSMNNILATIGRDTPLALRQIVFDSCPGDLSVYNTYLAASHSIPLTHPLRPVLCAALYLVVAGIAGLEGLGVRKHLARTIRQQLNSPDIFSSAAFRLYLASEADGIVDMHNIRSHKEHASANGLRTDLVVFSKARHCGLIVEDESRYWNSIVSRWEEGAVDPEK
ncbi:hypothetical protein M406DRAFT_342708 [Cryphonectria parasitica EP155]|uniref:DUF829-domain-containing protein n=1 Tax=Cryphonectria parasitica (strain ATCC 38755 / EP155) TaxID=660469 RepID=A0A9P5CK74_CRYP1|nr:uncharacterized protein M406DRAFT_342708 [Cryphonectria parasitica EP155]KAF3760460.1 hypothetical protein M406DRAFT_342708 [Cryphonectria parasitica EP155]